MSLNWIKWVKGLTRRREVLAIAQTLALDARIVASACMEIWEWADDNTTTGHVPGLTIENIDRLIGISGFGSALATAGWLDVRNDGIQFPSWERHNSQTAKKRALNSERQSRLRNGSVTSLSRKKRDDSSLISSAHQQALELYEVYPRKVAKGAALQAIKRALTKATYDVLLEAVKAYAAARKGEDSQFTPHPSTWFNEERWNDDRTQWKPKPKPGKSGPGQQFDRDAEGEFGANIQRGRP